VIGFRRSKTRPSAAGKSRSLTSSATSLTEFALPAADALAAFGRRFLAFAALPQLDVFK
jgi:hypothetical protein